MLIEVRRDGATSDKEFALISHRGRGFGPENTLESLEGALMQGVEMIETDVRMSGDGVLLIHHSPFLGLRLLSHMTLREIREKEPDIPTLEEYIELAKGRCSLNLEIKRADPESLAGILRRFASSRSPLVSSFDQVFLSEFDKVGIDVSLGLLSQYERNGEQLLKEARECGADTLLPAAFAAKADVVQKAHEDGLRVIPWTVNRWADLVDLITVDVDGAITDVYVEFDGLLREGTVEVNGGSFYGGANGSGGPE